MRRRDVRVIECLKRSGLSITAVQSFKDVVVEG